MKKTGIELIKAERDEQLTRHKMPVKYDVNSNREGQLISGAVAMLAQDKFFPSDWDTDICCKMDAKKGKERLIIAGAFIAAEIDRLQYIEVNNNTIIDVMNHLLFGKTGARRPSWNTGMHIIRHGGKIVMYDDLSGKIITSYDPEPEELVANDWQLVTTLKNENLRND